MSRRGRILGGVLAGLLFGTVFFATAGVNWLLSIRPPRVADAGQTLMVPLAVDADGTTRIGEAYAFRRNGVLACALAGSAFARGAALARFYPGELAEAETSLLDTVARFVPNGAARWLLARFVLVRDHRLARFLPEEIQAEMYGVSRASRDLYPQYGRHFTRLLHYLAAYDLAQDLMTDAPLADGTAFGLPARFTADGGPLLARTFDFPAGPALDRDKVVLLIRPERGHAFLSVAWPGMFGVVSGMNDAGLAVVLLGGHSSDPPGLGLPVSLVARRVLTEAATLDQAVAVIRQAPVFTSESFFLGSGPENAFVVVEKTPARTAVRRAPNRMATAVNVFFAPELKNDPVNIRNQRQGPALARLQRLTHLLAHAGRPFDVPLCVGLLRDRRGPEGGDLGLGNRQALNPLSASQAVVFDLQRKILWVSAYPHQLGEFVPFALEAFREPVAAPPVPADGLLTSGQYQAYLQYQVGIRQGERLIAQRRYQDALACLLNVGTLNESDYRSYLLAGRALAALHRTDEARYNYERARSRHPAFLREREEIDRQLSRFRKEQP